MDRSTDKSLWDRVCNLFGGRSGDSIEQAVMEARDEGELDLAEGSMILSILRLDDVQVQDIMTPRTDFDCMPTGAPVSEVAQCILETGHSRLPIYKDTRDNIIGIAYAKDLISLLVDPAKHHTAVDEIMRSPFFVPETKIVSELLQEFRSRKNHIAIAVDEYGGTSGLATIEDILEEIVGDIEDEHDAPRKRISILSGIRAMRCPVAPTLRIWKNSASIWRLTRWIPSAATCALKPGMFPRREKFSSAAAGGSSWTKPTPSKSAV